MQWDKSEIIPHDLVGNKVMITFQDENLHNYGRNSKFHSNPK